MRRKMFGLFVLGLASMAESSYALSASTGNAIADAALSRIGTPYLWGGKTTAAFDCSGLTSWAYRQAGYDGIPDGSAQQCQWCSRCTTQRGALLFFDTDFDGEIDHVAIRDRNGYMVHSADGQGVVRQKITQWYRDRLVTSASP